MSPEPSSTTWTAEFLLRGAITEAPLSVMCVDGRTGNTSSKQDLSGFQHAAWPPQTWWMSVLDQLKGNKPEYTSFTGTLTLSDTISPAALLVSYTGKAPEAKQPDSNRVYLSEATLSAEGQTDVTISAHAWVNTLNSPRVFFEGTGYLPSKTPAGLTALRQEELNKIKGVGNPLVHATRNFSDRVVDYDVYNDLGHLPVETQQDPSDPRPILGGNKDGFKYPRRIRTGRLLTGDGKETNPASGDMWVPQDQDFDAIKSGDFKSDTISDLALPIVAYQIRTSVAALDTANKQGSLSEGIAGIFRFIKNQIFSAEGKSQPPDNGKDYRGGEWDSFADVMAIYHGGGNAFTRWSRRLLARTSDVNPAFIAAKAEIGAKDEDVRAALRGLAPEKQDLLLRRAGIPPADWHAKDKRIDSSFWDLLRKLVNNALQWEVPLVVKGAHTPPLPSDGPNPQPRAEAWQTDEEYGRQWVAGQNPLVITAPSALPAECTINGSHVNGLLEGATLEELLSKATEAPRLFFVDYMEPHRSYAERIDARGGERKQHAGRLLLYKRNDGHLVPVAIELWHLDGSGPDGKTTVHTPANSHPQVWLVAKAIFASLDSGFHQLISHWLRTHACQEPYILATDRCLSAMHPVFKLLSPHFVYTLRMNANARSTLINQTGILEATFTPGKYVMELSAKVYESWKFSREGLSHDLLARGVAKAETDGTVNVLLDDYPYAEDGLLIWNALKKWNDGYLALYYKEDGDVAEDEELQAWWVEIRTKGHPDADPSGWPAACQDGIKTVADLSDITTTIAWLGSAHHAAVNFAQYDFSGLVLNRSTLIRAAIPNEGTPAYEALTSSDQAVFEKAFLTYIASAYPATRFVALMTVLSQHSPNEHFLSDDDQGLVYDEAALKLHKAFVADMKAAENTIAERNAGTSVARNPATAGLPYNYLVPSSPQLPNDVPNITGRGIPYSISI